MLWYKLDFLCVFSIKFYYRNFCCDCGNSKFDGFNCSLNEVSQLTKYMSLFKVDKILFIWQCSLYLAVFFIFGSVLFIWLCTFYLVVYFLFGRVLFIWSCTFYLAVHFLFDRVLFI